MTQFQLLLVCALVAAAVVVLILALTGNL